MADEDGQTTPQDGGDGQDTGGEQQPTQQGEQPAPPWGSDEQFDPEKAWRLIQNLRGDLDKAKAEREGLKGKVDEHEQSKLSETEKLAAARDELKARAEAAEGQLLRMEVAAEKGLTPAQAKRLQGSSKEELEADADELVSMFAARSSAPPSNRPREQYRGGTADPGEAPVEMDPAKLAELAAKSMPGGMRIR